MKKIDMLQVYRGDDYVVSDKILIHQPVIGEITDYGEKEYFTMVHGITAIPSDFKPELLDMGIDYEKISDLEMFYMMTRSLGAVQTGILFGDIDLSRLKMFMQPNGELLLFDEETEVRIDRHIHAIIMQYLTKLHGIVKKPEFAANQGTKDFLIEDDRTRKRVASKKPYESMLLPLISSMVNSAGFKYDIEGSLGMKLFAFFDSVQRIGVIQSSLALLQGGYSGMADLSKVPKESWNWARDMYKKEK
ncbi:MAG: hypothetical protein PHX74_06525 [Candidatus Sumerlaeales bacterium]|nr:hypothetical protein [Candidatus Sumerlaeales bacterium]